jgi:protocatechuate 3,4-dioxygenase beta subunit
VNEPTRRALLKAVLAVPAARLAGGFGSEAFAALEPTPECADDEPTPPQTAGPFFKPDTPQRASLREPGLRGTPLVVSGLVLATSCRPLANALLDFWHTDDEGRYDLSGFRMRGHQFSDAAGRYRLETILPGAYSGRTRHIHVRVQAPAGRILTTQLYFPGEARNETDGIFSPRLLMDVTGSAGGREARFDFVLKA